jgi:hypothetical protein
MGVTREELYQQVWAEPMLKVAARYEVSSNYLARVCEYLNVPRPPRGFWAKQSVGKAPKRPPLPIARPGEVLEWAKGDTVPHPLRSELNVDTDRADTAAKLRSSRRQERHELVVAVREFFEAGRLSEVGYLRPLKRNLVDVFVSKPVLTYALDAANELFQALEKRGHRVALAPSDEYHRPALTVHQGHKFDYYDREPWRPARKTVVYIGDIALGLTVYESTEEVAVTYEWNRPVRYVRVSEAPPKLRPKWMGADPDIKRPMPSGRLAVRAYSPYGGVSWEQRWLEEKVGGLSRKIATIVRELESVVPTIVQRREEAQRQAEIERQRWEAECREQERREQERRRAQAVKESPEQLFAIVDAWPWPTESRGSSMTWSGVHRPSTRTTVPPWWIASDKRGACWAGLMPWPVYSTGRHQVRDR